MKRIFYGLNINNFMRKTHLKAKIGSDFKSSKGYLF